MIRFIGGVVVRSVTTYTYTCIRLSSCIFRCICMYPVFGLFLNYNVMLTRNQFLFEPTLLHTLYNVIVGRVA
jgi:hypothetical protein